MYTIGENIVKMTKKLVSRSLEKNFSKSPYFQLGVCSRPVMISVEIELTL